MPRSAIRLLLAAVLAIWLPGSEGGALAQSGILDKAKDLLGGGAKSKPSRGAGLSDQEIGGGLREALRVGTEKVVARVGALDGYNGDSKIHIPLPGALQDVQSALKKVGMSRLADDLELKLNRAAEAAAPEAKQLFWKAIEDMTLDDVRGIYGGPDDAATQYFKGKMSPPLAERMTPIVKRSLEQVGAVQSFETMMTEYKAIPFAPDVTADLTKYVVQKGMDGIFLYVAEEEAAIRNNPAARSTELLKRVFGAG